MINLDKFKKHKKYIDKEYVVEKPLVQRVAETAQNLMEQNEANKQIIKQGMNNFTKNSMATNMMNRAQQLGKSFDITPKSNQQQNNKRNFIIGINDKINRIGKSNITDKNGIKPNVSNAIIKNKKDEPTNKAIPMNVRENNLADTSNMLKNITKRVELSGFSKNIQEQINNTKGKARIEQVGRLTNNNKKDIANTSWQVRQEQALEDANKSNEKFKKAGILGKVGHVVGNTAQGIFTGAATGFADPVIGLTNFADNVNQSLGGKTKDRQKQELGISTAQLYNQAKQERAIYGQNLNTINKLTNSLGQQVGYMMPSMVVGGMAEAGIGFEEASKVVEKLPKIIEGLEVGGSTYIENLNKEESNYLKAGFKGLLYGTATYNIEGLTGGNFLTKNGSLDDKAKKLISEKISGDLKQKIASKGYEILGENLEENIENLTDNLIDFAMGDKTLKEALKDTFSEVKDTTTQTTLLTSVLSLFGLGGNTYNEIQTERTNQRNEIIDNSNLGENSKAQLKELSEKNNWEPEVLQNMLEQGGNLKENQDTTTQNNIRAKQIFNEMKQNEDSEQNYNQVIENLKDIYQNQPVRMQNNEVSQTNQQTIQEQQKMAQNGNVEQIGQNNFKSGLDKFKSKKYNQNDHIEVLNKLPNQFYNLGYNTEQPLYLNMNKLETIMKEPKGTVDGANQHGITMDIIEQLPEALNNPLNIIKNPKFRNRFVMVTNLTDQYGDMIVVPVEINHENAEVQGISKINSIYGKETYDTPRNDNEKSYMEYNKENIVYDIDNNRSDSSNYRLQLPSETTNTPSEDTVDNVSSTNNIIPQNEKNNNNFGENNINIANNQNMQYNNTESEGGLNEQINRTTQEGNMGRDNGESRLFEKNQQKQLAEQKYREWEKSITTKAENELTTEERQLKQEIKNTKGKNVEFIKSDNGKGYYAGASLDDNTKIYINTEEARKFGLKRTALHETMESNIRFADENTQDIITSAIDDLIADKEIFEQQKEEFWNGQEGEMPSDTAIAKDIICDRYAELNGEKLDYTISDEVKNKIDLSIEYFENQNSNKSSFLVEENIPDNKKVRKHYKSIIESSQTSSEAKKIAKELMGQDAYYPDSNKAQLQRADERIMKSSPDDELKTFTSKLDNGDKLKADDIALGERLIKYYSKIGDSEKLQLAIQNTAMAGTELGQAVQAMSILNHQTPVGQVSWIERSINKVNQEILNKKGYTLDKDTGKITNRNGKDVTDKVPLFDFTAEMQQKILNSDKNNMSDVLDEVYEELGQQVPKSIMEKIDSWRYFAMLGNVRTHVRNIVGNVGMSGVQKVKNKVAGGIEDIVSIFNPNMERTKSLVKVSSIDTIKYAMKDINNVKDELGLGENKYNPQSRLKNNQRTFKHDALEYTVGELFSLNDDLLEAEDGIGLKYGYVRAMSEYITANDIDVNNITEKQLRKARNYAINQAQEATFHQANAIASAINQFSKKNGLTKGATDAILPFVKTPLNVAKAGLEYNPAGLIYNSIKGVHDLRTGKINVNQYIDNVSKGLTGTGIALLGYALAKAGILKASGGDDDKKENFDEANGSQAYSIKIGGSTYTLDWMAPTAIPLFVGAEAYNIINNNKKEKSTSTTDEDSKYNQALETATNLLDAVTNSMNPMTEMSMLSGLTSALRSYDQDSSKMLASIGTNAGKSYINQFVPTLLGQVAKTRDDYQRKTTSTKTGILPKAIDQTKNQIMAKIPGLREKLPVATDVWGNDVKQPDNMVQRAFENMVLPYSRKDLANNKVNSALNDLYSKTGEGAILPSGIKQTLTINSQDYRLTSEEYAKYSKDYGQNAYKLINDLVSSKSYKDLSDNNKVTAIKDVYDYVKEVNKVDYAKKVNQEYETSTLYDTIKELQKQSANTSSYFEYKANTQDMKKDIDKIKSLKDMSTDSKTKDIIYQETLMDKEEGKQTEYEQLKDYYTKNSLPGVRGENIIDTYLDYKVKSNEKLKELRSNGTKKENENLNSKDKVQLLKDLGYEKTKTEAMFVNVVAEDSTKEKYNWIKKINNNKNSVNDYMTYLLADTSADKKDNGLKSGKTIKGSGQKKTFNVIEGLEMNDLAKTYLYATRYAVNKKNSSNYYYKLKKYVDTLSKSEQKEILSTITSAKETTSGGYYWE